MRTDTAEAAAERLRPPSPRPQKPRPAPRSSIQILLKTTHMQPVTPVAPPLPPAKLVKRKRLACIKPSKKQRQAAALENQLQEIDEELRHHLRHPERGIIDNVISLRVPHSDVAFVAENLKQKSMRVQQKGYPAVGWPRSTKSRCWWCRGRIRGPPCIMPSVFNSRANVYECEGFFHSWSCVLRYMMEHGTKPRLANFLRSVLHVPGVVAGHVVAAPHWKTLQCFGGSLSRAQFNRLLTSGITIDVYTSTVMPLHSVQWTSVYARLYHLRGDDATTKDRELARLDIEDGVFRPSSAAATDAAPPSLQPASHCSEIAALEGASRVQAGPTPRRRNASHHPRRKVRRGRQAPTKSSHLTAQASSASSLNMADHDDARYRLVAAAAKFRVSRAKRHEKKTQSSLDQYMSAHQS